MANADMAVQGQHATGASAATSPGVLRRFRQHRLAMCGAIVIVALVLIAILAPIIAPQGPEALNLLAVSKPPGSGHLLGTDDIGRDIWARLVFGARTSLAVGFGAMALAVIFGTLLGVAAGLAGRWVDAFAMRLVDATMSIPSLLMVIFVVSIAGPSLEVVIVAIAATGWPIPARVVRGQVLALREREFMTAARVIGVPTHRVVLDHLVPNLLGPLSVVGTLGVATAILTEAGLSFLGLGVRPPTPSWGQMISSAESAEVLLHEWWMWVPASLAITTTVLAVNFVGDGLRDAFDPRSERWLR